MKNFFLGFALLLSATVFAQYTYTETATNGNTILQGQYNTNPNLDPNDSKETKATKLAGVSKVGVWKYWTESGVLIAEEYYTMSGTRTGVWKTWTNSGVLSTEINFSTGIAVFYHQNGQKSEEGHINTEMQHTGAWKGWHDNGQLNYEGSFDSNGNKTGLWKFYDAQGNNAGTENN